MKALILNSGLGSRMGDATKKAPKCMSVIREDTTILSNQIDLLKECGIHDIVITTGAHNEVLKDYLKNRYPDEDFTFVHNDIYDKTNYIYSIYLARKFLVDDIVLMHGDLVFKKQVLEGILKCNDSCVVTDKSLPLPEKDFKAVIKDGNVIKVGIEYFDNACACQPLYKLKKKDWLVWLRSIVDFCENDNRKVYAENALNEVSAEAHIVPYDIKGLLCQEIDTLDDLKKVKIAFEQTGI